MNIKVLEGKTLVKINTSLKGNNYIDFITSDYKKYRLEHYQDCCEHVYIEDICGDLSDLIGTEIIKANEVSNGNQLDSELNEKTKHLESFLWTFYKFATIKGYVDIRWLGSSNGYYSESVDFGEIIMSEMEIEDLKLELQSN